MRGVVKIEWFAQGIGIIGVFEGWIENREVKYLVDWFYRRDRDNWSKWGGY